MRLNRSPLALIRITDKGLKDHGNGRQQAGAACGPVITLRPGYEGDIGLLAHELFHVGRWWLIGLLASALLALAGWLVGSIEVAGIAFPAWSFAPLGMATNSLAYVLWPEWRAAEEIAAYRVQAGYYADDRMPKFAQFLADNYGLDMTADEALRRLREG